MGKNRSAFGAKKESQHGYVSINTGREFVPGGSVINGWTIHDKNTDKMHHFPKMWDAIGFREDRLDKKAPISPL